MVSVSGIIDGTKLKPKTFILLEQIVRGKKTKQNTKWQPRERRETNKQISNIKANQIKPKETL